MAIEITKRYIRKLSKAIKKKERKINEIKIKIQECSEALKHMKPVILKEIMNLTGAKMNYYSCISIDKKNQHNLLCRNNNEDKMQRVRPEEHFKGHGSHTGFAKKRAEFADKWWEFNGKKMPTIK